MFHFNAILLVTYRNGLYLLVVGIFVGFKPSWLHFKHQSLDVRQGVVVRWGRRYRETE